AHPGDVVHEGQQLKLKIISLDSERHRLGLSLKQAEEPPARPAPESGQPAPSGTRPERRPRPERSYSMSDAVQEPEGGIDNTLASAFAQVRQQLADAEVSDAPEGGSPAEVTDTAAEADTEVEKIEAAEETLAAEAIADVVDTVATDEAVVEAAAEDEIERLADAAAANEANEAVAAADAADVVETVAKVEAAEEAAAASVIEDIVDAVVADEAALEAAVSEEASGPEEPVAEAPGADEPAADEAASESETPVATEDADKTA
ncbi:MAG: hypothetical protein OEX05_12045, partial [Chloroflexota bacterium]|nr:hypothetical protein [Chloroflexota bacterium]